MENKVQNILYNKYLILLFSSLVVAGFAIAGWIHFEEFTDITIAAFLSGHFSLEPEGIFNNYNMLLGWAPLLERLQGTLPGQSVYGVFILVLMALLLWHYACLGIQGYPSGAGKFYCIAYGAVLFLLIFPVILFPQITVLAILLQGSSLLHFVNGQKNENLSLSPLYLLPVFTASVLLRAEAAFLVLVFLAPLLYLLLANQQRERRSFLRALLVVLTLLVALTLLGSTGWTADDARYAAFRPYKVAAWDQGIEVSSLHPANPEDEAIARAFQQLFLADADRITPSRLEQIGFPKLDKDMGLMWRTLFHVGPRLENALLSTLISMQVMGFGGPALLLLLIFLLYCSRILPDNQFHHFLAVQVWFGLLFFGLAYLLKMEARFLAPMLLLNILGCWLWWIARKGMDAGIGRMGVGLVAAAFLFLVLHNGRRLENIFAQQRAQAKIPEFLQEGQLAKNEIQLFNYQSVALLFPGPLESRDRPEYAAIGALDFGYLRCYDSHMKHLVQLTGEQTFALQIQSFVDRGAIWVSTAERMAVLETYMQDVYHRSYRSVAISPDSLVMSVNYTPLCFRRYRLEAFR